MYRKAQNYDRIHQQQQTALKEAFSQLTDALVPKRRTSTVPGMRPVERNLFAFDLEQRFLLAQTRAWLKGPEGHQLLSIAITIFDCNER